MKVLIISFSDLKRDPRVSRQIRWLSESGHSLTTVGLGPPLDSVDRHVNLILQKKRPLRKKIMKGFQLLFRQYKRYIRTNFLLEQLKNFFENNQNKMFDLIIVNDLDPLPIATLYRGEAKILLDAHEYSPEEFSDRFLWRFLVKNYVVWLCRTYLPQIDAMITVNLAIASKYAITFGVPVPKVITNAGPAFDLTPIDPDPMRIRLIYHGVASPSRHVECMIELFSHLDNRFELDMMLVPGEKSYIESIKKQAKRFSKIHFLEPVAMKEIVPFTNQYDIGVFLLPPVNFNYLNALPNKLFEFIQARLAVAIGNSPAMKEIVGKYQCGIVSNDFHPKTLAMELNRLSKDDIAEMKMNAHKASFELNAEANQKVFSSIVQGKL